MWDKLEARADVEVFGRFPKLATAPKMDQESLVEQEKGTLRQVFTPWRVWRGMAPPSLPTQDTVFLGVVAQPQGVVRSESSSVGAYAYMNNKLGPVKCISKPSKQVRLEQTVAGDNDIAIKQIGTVDDIMYDTALFQRWGKWRTPYGFGVRNPEVVFEGIAYFDMLLQDLGLRSWRKGWGWLGEMFGGVHGQADYNGLMEEWNESRKRET